MAYLESAAFDDPAGFPADEGDPVTRTATD